MIEAPNRDAHGPRVPDGRSRPWQGGGAKPGAHGGPEQAERRRRRLVLAGCCLVLAALAFVSHPGNLIADTKIDMAVNPAGFLGRALQMWDPAQFGFLQDQAAGYLFPVGPFFLLLKIIAVPGWIAQRLWISAILAAAFLGIVRLSARLGIGSPASQVVAGFAYALAPNWLGELGSLSSEILPIAMLPWILLPLVTAVRKENGLIGNGTVRAAAQSALAVAFCSGINAAAVIAVLVPPVIYLLTAPATARRLRIACCWVPAVLLATSWWLIPLLLEDKYGVSILPYTESAATTTSVTSLFNALRGAENWISYLVVNGQPWWPVAFRLASESAPTILAAAIAGLGLVGLLSRGMPQRKFLLCLVLVGLLVISTGYVSGLGNPLAAPIDHLINGGPLASFRNLRKFDPLIRLPLVLGVAHLLPAANRQLPSAWRDVRSAWRQLWPACRQLARPALSLLTCVAIAGLALPVYVSGLSTPGSFQQFPSYWVSAASWLNRHAGNSAILAVPGARFGQYTWGSPMDDVLEALSTGDWASSQLSVIGSVGNARLLETVDQQMAAGEGSAGLTQLLARMGIKYVLVRNDLIRSDLYGAWPARVLQAIAESPGLVKVAQFGPASSVGSSLPGDAISGFDTPYPPVEIYQVSSAQPVVTVQPTADTMRVYGAPEALLTLADQGLLKNRPVLLNSDGPSVHAASTVVTDSLRRRVRNFGEIRNDYSPTLTAGQSASTFEAADDFLEPSWQKYLAVAQYHGIANVTASSSAADIQAIPAQFGTGRLPFAAVDGNFNTMWESGSLGGPVGQWIKLDFLHAENPGVISVAFADNIAIGPQVTGVEISTATGQVADKVKVTGRYQPLRVPPGSSPWLKIEVASVLRPPHPDIGRQVGIAEIAVPGVNASRSIDAPDVRLPGGADPTAVVLAKAEPQPSACMLTSARWVCSPSLETSTEEQYGFDHSFTVAQPETARLTGTAVLTSPSLIERYAFPGRQQPSVTGSSSYVSDPEDLPSSAFDANPLTTWVSGAFDRHPTLTIGWHGFKRVSTVTIQRPPGANGPLAVRITGSRGQVRTGALGAGSDSLALAALSFAPMRTDSLTLRFSPAQLPVQITDVTIPGVRPLTVADNATFRLPCGFGPEIDVDGSRVPTRVSGTFADLLEGRPMSFTACSGVSVRAGGNRVIEPSTDGFSVQTVVLDQTGPGSLAGAARAVAARVRTISWTDTRRVLAVAAPRQSFLVVDQNFNAGWQASVGGKVLQPVQLDGWKQGWLLPAGTRGLVTLSYRPQSLYRVSVVGGLIALAVIAVLGFVPLWRRRRAAATDTVQAGERSRRRWRPRWPGWLVTSAWVAVSAAIGFWVGGAPGAILLPAATLLFVAVIAYRDASRILAVAASPWLTLALLLAAAVSAVVGARLSQDTATFSAGQLLSLTVPQVLCMVVVARLLAAALLPDQPALPPQAATEGDDLP
jgi:arabinofuranan 3-O-arabinosyltransferase